MLKKRRKAKQVSPFTRSKRLGVRNGERVKAG
jgi:hypothetical protein